MKSFSDKELESITEEVCDKLCRYPEKYRGLYADPDEANTAMMDEECVYCPLGALKWTDR